MVAIRSEMKFHAKELDAILSMVEPRSQDAVRGLEHCAVLVQDDLMTPHVDRDKALRLFKAAFGKSPGSFRKNTVIPIEGRGTGEPVYRSSLIRGVVADLNLEMKLVSVTVTPRLIREGNKMMGVVGIARDARDDVSVKHDDYLAEIHLSEISSHEPS